MKIFKNKYITFIVFFLLGFLILHPLSIILGHVMHEWENPGSHLDYQIVVIKYLQSFSLGMIAWGVMFGLLSGFTGYSFVSLKIQKDLLKKANDSKDRFFSIIAHDLRNPFSAIIGLFDVLLRLFDSLPDVKKKTLIRSLQDSSRQTHKLLENLLQWSRLQLGDIKPNFQRVKVSGLVSETILLTKSKADSKSITIEDRVTEDVVIKADSNMISLVIRNLVENALKFTPKGGRIVLSSSRKGSSFEILIEDTGIGLTEEEISQLFRIEMKRSKPGTEKETGSGLGLILCKEFVEKNNGTLSVSSVPDKGSTFKITLPAHKD